MPDTPTLLLRRQPGLLPIEYTVERAGCAQPQRLTLTTDTLLTFDGTCPTQ
jgi:hypothetical protein